MKRALPVPVARDSESADSGWSHYRARIRIRIGSLEGGRGRGAAATMSLKVDLQTNTLDGSLSFTLSRSTNASGTTLTIVNPKKDTFGVYKVHGFRAAPAARALTCRVGCPAAGQDEQARAIPRASEPGTARSRSHRRDQHRDRAGTRAVSLARVRRRLSLLDRAHARASRASRGLRSRGARVLTLPPAPSSPPRAQGRC